jgi:hypothetical protein
VELVGLLSQWNLLWCIRADFNVALFPNERLGESRFCHAMVEFSNLIFLQGFIVIYCLGGNFMWSNNWDPPSCSRIDRFLVSSN